MLPTYGVAVPVMLPNIIPPSRDFPGWGLFVYLEDVLQLPFGVLEDINVVVIGVVIPFWVVGQPIEEADGHSTGDPPGLDVADNLRGEPAVIGEPVTPHVCNLLCVFFFRVCQRQSVREFEASGYPVVCAIDIVFYREFCNKKLLRGLRATIGAERTLPV